MNFQQLRAVREAARNGYNLTEVAHVLYTSQPGVSRQIRELEDELGVDIFIRAGKRLTGLTPPGEAILPIVDRLLLESENLRRAGADFHASRSGQLSIAATHSQARYALPLVVRDFREQFPDVALHLHQGSPRQVAEMLLSGAADIGVATEALTGYASLATLPGYRWTHSVVVPPGHPLLAQQEAGRPLTLQSLVRFPIITYEQGYTGRSHIDESFSAAEVTPNVVLTAMDADVIKTYVELGMGIGIVASIAFDEERDRNLRAIDAGHLFKVNTTRIALRKGVWLRAYALQFIESFVPTLKREVVLQAVSATAPDDASAQAATQKAA
ncbi:CysB family HTH-type transcriptional regulator [Comamonas sp. JNW]|uniref:CysB family HTH-type transcriptional regulator n=1 Tax=Comamonas sp. JNW TaxID=2170731 RepID=UPI000DE7060E|nr:CysB family HTH-type transcriptional regulator [Comamonas sp. JNW]PWB14716.1 transcriptional regulator [Comamonas sp. JNW]